MNKRNILMLFGIYILIIVSSCTSDDPTPPSASVHSVRGRVLYATGAAVNGVVVTCGTYTDTTDTNGAYEFKDIEGKSYTVTPVKSGYTFTPSVRTVDISNADANNIDFTAASTVVIEMIDVPPGTFTMGGIKEWGGGGSESRPQHQVTLTRGFYVGKYEITQDQWIAVMGPDSLIPGDPLYPVFNMNWMKILKFCNKLSDMHGYARVYIINGSDVQWNWDANGYRLPVEAEWEYMARAGTTDNTYIGNFDIYNESGLDIIAWWRTRNPIQGGVRGPRPVGTKQPNPWGIYDVIGNVHEFCFDDMRIYNGNPTTNPVGQIGSSMVRRGGAWAGGVFEANCTSRLSQAITIVGDQGGFRVCRTHN